MEKWLFLIFFGLLLIVHSFIFSEDVDASNDLLWSYREMALESDSLAVQHYNRALYYETKGDLTNARDYYERALHVQPDLLEARNNLGALLYDLGLHDEAIIELRRAIELNPEYATAHYNLGSVYFAVGRFTDAIKEYKIVIEELPELTNAHFFLGQSYNQIGDYLNAIKAIEFVVTEEPDNVYAHYYLASNLAAAKKFQRALHHYERVIELDPHFIYRQEVLEMIRKIKGISA